MENKVHYHALNSGSFIWVHRTQLLYICIQGRTRVVIFLTGYDAIWLCMGDGRQSRRFVLELKLRLGIS